MAFSTEQWLKIVRWDPTDPAFESVDLISRYITPALLQVPDTHSHTLIERGDYGNYAHVLVHRALNVDEIRESRHHRPVTFDGISVNLSLTVPIAAMAFTTARVASGSFGSGVVDLDDVIEPSRGNHPLADIVLDVFANTPYEFVSRAFLSEPLPAGITPFEYCLGSEPWDRVFHGLFANSD